MPAGHQVHDERSVLASYTPMAPAQVREPFHKEEWVYEEKRSQSKRERSFSS